MPGAARRREKGGRPNRLLGSLANYRGSHASRRREAPVAAPTSLRKASAPPVFTRTIRHKRSICILAPSQRVLRRCRCPSACAQGRPKRGSQRRRTEQRLCAARSGTRRPNRPTSGYSNTDDERTHDRTGQTEPEPNTFFAFRLHAHPPASQSASVQHSPKLSQACCSGSISTFSLHDGLLRTVLLTQ